MKQNRELKEKRHQELWRKNRKAVKKIKHSRKVISYSIPRRIRRGV